MLSLLATVPTGAKVTLALLGLLACLLYRFLTKNFDHWKKKGVKFVQPVPVFGSVASQFMMKEHVTQWMQAVYRKYEGEPYVGFFQGRQPVLMVMDRELIKNILVKDFSHFTDHSFHINEESDPINGRNLIMMTGQKWKDLRHKLLPTLTSGKMKMMFPSMLHCAQQFDEHLKNIADGDAMVEMRDLLGCFFTDVIGSCIFGINTNTMKEPNNQLRVMGRKMEEMNLKRVIKSILILFVPEVASRLKIGMFEQDITNFFCGLVKQLVAERKKSNSVRKDFLQLLIELKEKGSISLFDEEEKTNLENSDKSLFEFTDDDIMAQTTIFFIAGHAASSAVVSFALLELAANPEVQTKAQLEIDESLASSDNAVTYDSFKNMTYLDWILQETLRKYPPQAFHNRDCTKTYTIPGTNLTIEKGTMIAIPNHALQNDPKYFPNPDQFDPERFGSDDALHRYQYLYSPFGEGPRQCIGNRFGLLQSKMALFIFLRNYTVRICEKTVYPINIDPKKQFIAIAKDGIWLKLENRSCDK